VGDNPERIQGDLFKKEEQQREAFDARAMGGREHIGKATILVPGPIGGPPLPKYDGTTSGVLITNEGQTVPFQSGNADPVYDNYVAAGHAEGKAALWIRQNRSSGGVVYHNNPEGTCPYCDKQLRTLLPEGSVLTAVPPADAVPRNNSWIGVAKPYAGNSKVPNANPSKQKGDDDDNF
jgi:hypothetical protein